MAQASNPHVVSWLRLAFCASAPAGAQEARRFLCDEGEPENPGP